MGLREEKFPSKIENPKLKEMKNLLGTFCRVATPIVFFCRISISVHFNEITSSSIWIFMNVISCINYLLFGGIKHRKSFLFYYISWKRKISNEIFYGWVTGSDYVLFIFHQKEIFDSANFPIDWISFSFFSLLVFQTRSFLLFDSFPFTLIGLNHHHDTSLAFLLN